MGRPVLLDLFCGAGGAGMGYHQAGFDVIGVDEKPQPNYPFRFVQGDALDVLAGADLLPPFAAIHASPPCQAHSAGTLPQRLAGSEYPDLIGPTRRALLRTGVPWVIENVPGAPVRADYKLCGCLFGLPGLRRERWFETSWGGFEMRAPCWHTGSAVTVSGHGSTSRSRARLRGERQTVADWRAAMGIDWMNRDELAEAIPPAFTAS
jgi:DNA (cytosine-5)-methyltransferase 1